MPAPVQLVRFGTFELDLSFNELRKNGRKIRLQEQSFRLLNLLVETPGHPVSRERMKEALWTADTFVDFDHSLNAAISKLRVALDDPADNPRFVETVPRKGYRFIAPVEFIGAPAHVDNNPAASQPSAQVRDGSRKWLWLPVSIVVLVVLALIAFKLWHTKPRETELVRLTNGFGLNTDPAVSPDGKLLVYASDRGSGGNLDLWIQQLGVDTDPVQLTHDQVDVDHPAFSPDGSTIAFHSAKDGGGIYLIPAIGGEASRLCASGRNPKFSPDGRWIAYFSGAVTGEGILSGNGSGGVFKIPVSGGSPVRLGADIEAPASPVWSPDGRHLLVYVPPKTGYVWNNADWWFVSADASGRSQRTGDFTELRRQGFSLGFDRVPSVAEWAPNFITFAAGFGDAVNVWRAPLSDTGRIVGPASRLTSGTTLEVEPAMALRGDAIFASLSRRTALWSLAADTDHATVTGTLSKITKGLAEIMPSLSANGERMAYTAGHARGNFTSGDLASPEALILQTKLQDLSTGKEMTLPKADLPQWHPQISRDGSMVAYTSGKPGDLFATPFDSPNPRMLLGGSNCFTWDWSLDNRRLLYNACTSARDQQVYMLDVSSGQKKPFIGEPGSALFQAKFSPDDQAAAFLRCHEDKPGVMECRIFITPLKNYVAGPAQQWIRIDHSGLWDDKPRWSPNGAVLYFISDRDGFLCLWAQRLEPRTKHPIGAPFAVCHFHNSRLAMSNLDTGFLEFAVAKNKIVFGLGEITGDIWTARRRP